MGVVSGLPGGGCILPRTYLLFTRMDMAEVPLRQRREAVLLELEQDAPFEEPSGWVVWDGSRANVWYWPAELENRALAGSDGEPTAVPETALWPRLHAEECRWVADPKRGLYLLQFQHPRSGLSEKRYPSAPSANEAIAWFKRHGAKGELTELSAQPAPALELTRGPLGSTLKPVSSSLEKRVFPVTAALLGFLLVVYCLAIARAWWETGQLGSERAELQAQVEDVIVLRNRAAELLAANQLLGDVRQPSQLIMSSVIAQTLEVNSVRLIRWVYRNDQLELLWRPDEKAPDPTALIRNLEALPAFSGVQAEINADEAINVNLEVSGELKPIKADSLEKVGGIEEEDEATAEQENDDV